MRVLVIGPGYVGFETAKLLVSQGHDVSALCRSARNRADLVAARIHPLEGDVTDLESIQQLPADWDWVVNCVSSSRGGQYRAVYFDGTRNLLSWLSKSPQKKYVYTSSTGVYGQNDGSTVTESSPTEPDSETGGVLVETEQALLTAARENRFPAVILRISGIYGPGRGYWLNQFVTGEAQLSGDGSRIVNMVHRNDVAGAIVAALQKGKAGQVYNVSDDEPVSQRDLFKWLAETLHKPMPPQSPEGIGTTRKRRAGSKRVSNARLKEEVGYKFGFPTFREGFRALLEINSD